MSGSPTPAPTPTATPTPAPTATPTAPVSAAPTSTPVLPTGTGAGTIVVPQNIDANGNLTGSQDLTGNTDAPQVGHLGAKSASTGEVLKSTAEGAVTGAAIGSVIPAVGTAVGGLVGGAVGAVAGFFGGGDTRGAVEKALKACDVDSLPPKIAAYRTAEKLLTDLHTKLTEAKPKLDAAWKDDIGKQASSRVSDMAGSAANLAVAARKNADALQALHDTIKPVKDRFGHDDSTTSNIGNFVTHGRDHESLNAYNGMIDDINKKVLPKYPQSVNVTLNGETSTFDTGKSSPNLNGANPNAGGGPNGVGTPNHLATPTMPAIVNPKPPKTVKPPPFKPPKDPTTVDPTDPNDTGLGLDNPPYQSGLHPVGIGSGGNLGTGYGTGAGSDPNGLGDGSGFGIDSGASLAGIDPNGLGGGAGSLGSLDGGLGTGSLDGAGSMSGAAGAGAGAGSGALGAGSGTGAGSAGMMTPMMGGRGGGAGGDEDERERNTWLTEDDDVWGGSDAPSGTI